MPESGMTRQERVLECIGFPGHGTIDDQLIAVEEADQGPAFLDERIDDYVETMPAPRVDCIPEAGPIHQALPFGIAGLEPRPELWETDICKLTATDEPAPINL